MDQQGPWMANYIAHLKPEFSEVKVPIARQWELKDRTTNTVWGVAPFPTAVPGLTNVSYNSFDALMIPSGARHAKEAFEFMAYVNRQDVAEKLNILHCKNCQLRHVSESFSKSIPILTSGFFRTWPPAPMPSALRSARSGRKFTRRWSTPPRRSRWNRSIPADALRNTQTRMQDQCDRFERLLEERRRLHLD